MAKLEHYRLSEEIPLVFGQMREQIDQLPDPLKNLLVGIFTEAAAKIPNGVSSHYDNACEILFICGYRGPIAEGVRSAIALYPGETKINSQLGLRSSQEKVTNALVFSNEPVKDLELRIIIGLGKTAARISRVVDATPELVKVMDDFCSHQSVEVIKPSYFSRANLATILASLHPKKVVGKIVRRSSKKG